MKKRYDIHVDCAGCAMKMEDAAKKVEGVSEASVNYMLQKMTVVYDDSANESKIVKSISKACKKIDSDFEISF
ncbi:MAG: heavy-metal-associated domain-containing protein [Clostridia bacterium]|nr:heavy-metal-associated domain-containing protein [Clostridia bacterium]